MRAQNSIELDFANSPDLAAIFSGKEPGDKCKFEVTMQIGEIDEKGVKGSIDKISSDYDDEEKVATPQPEAPMAVKITPMPM